MKTIIVIDDNSEDVVVSSYRDIAEFLMSHHLAPLRVGYTSVTKHPHGMTSTLGVPVSEPEITKFAQESCNRAAMYIKDYEVDPIVCALFKVHTDDIETGIQVALDMWDDEDEGHKLYEAANELLAVLSTDINAHKPLQEEIEGMEKALENYRKEHNLD